MKMSTPGRALRIVAISDTHDRHRDVTIPEGDVLVHAGDITKRGMLDDILDFDAFLATLPHRHKIVVCGNHDWCFERQPEAARAAIRHATFLLDEAVTIEGVRFYGSPWQPWFYDWAFNLPRGEPLRQKWALIPDDTDVLITHGPPHGVLDLNLHGEPTGCEELRRRVDTLRPRLHVFGHIHEGHGTVTLGRTTFINASICTVAYRPTNAPIVYDYVLP